MTTIEIVKINDQLIEAWNRHNIDKLLSLCDDNIIYRISNGMATYKGKTEVSKYFNDWITAFPNLMYKVCNWIAADDTIAVEYEFTGTHNGSLSIWPDLNELLPTKWKVTTYGSYFLKLKEGKIAEVSKYPDRFSLFDQLGLLKEVHHLSF